MKKEGKWHQRKCYFISKQPQTVSAVSLDGTYDLRTIADGKDKSN